MAKFSLKKEKITDNNKPKISIKKIVGICLVVFCSFAFLSLFTSLISFLKSFLLGVFGLFAYPVFIILFIVGIALINNKKYVMSKRYAISILIAIISILSIVDLALMHNFSGNYGQWLAYSYNHKLTAGGFIIGFITAPFRFLIFEAGSYVVFSILLIVAIGLIIDYFRFAKNYKEYKKPVKVVENNKPVEVLMTNNLRQKTKNIDKTNITLDAEIEQNKTELTTKEKLGLINNRTIISSPNVFEKQPPIAQNSNNSELDKVNSGKMSIKEYLLTKPSNIDLTYLRKDFSNNNKNSIVENIQKVKNEPTPIVQQQKPQQELIVHDDFGEINSNTNYFASQNNNYFEENTSLSKPSLTDKEEKIDNSDNDSFMFEDNSSAIDNLEDEVLKSINNPDNVMDLNAPSVDLTSSRRRERFVNLEKPDENKFNKTEQVKIEEVEPIKPAKQKSTIYKTPPIEMLTTESMDTSELAEDMSTKKDQLEYALETFNIPAKVKEITIGPAVTRFELEMPVGISVKKLVAHADDIALTLAANGGIRIEAPIPGKSVVGIELPNSKIATVGLKEIFSSQEFKNAQSPLTVALGKDISGNIRLCDIAKMPHLLIAGATNSGKSVCLNAIILSLIAKNSPDDLRLILIDPKRVEFTMYNDLPHLIMPKVISDSDKAVNALKYCVCEMERRFGLLQDQRARNIAEYNSCQDVISGKTEKLPYIVFIIDELADLMVVAKKEVEENLQRLAQKARAAGIHLVLATQRPSVDVITGLIKANFPSRITFALTSFADSKTILDQGGAEKLLGKGDMLYLPSDAASPRRIQGCFMTGTEVINYVEFIKDNNSYDFDASVETSINAPKQTNVSELVDGKQDNGFDELLPQALKLVIENGQASISILQRKLMIGFPRAGKIIDQMEQAGYISSSDGSKPRSVYITMEEWEEKFKKD